MDKVKMLGEYIGVKMPAKSTKQDGIFVEVEQAHNFGVIESVGDLVTSFSPGDQVYYGNERQTIRMGNTEIQVMKASNIYAIKAGE